ncbi:hypothetical protein KBB96_18670 [Luteolibacter ambystomatis]|uniref:Uncharacterized protein n=1 Tax=Luteolibacter ambystomatis TaxID=2824561 RepID=A0A975G8S9_9BACT|nr:hypothetical protein [Luteolibacter ambystomatis]QUE50871.1 hypothetical protein KBB96_18670 [Luteolibacter ambystomatis]
MIRCLPRGICSPSYHLEGEGHQAEILFNAFGEGGELVIDGRSLTVEKQGFLSGSWALVDGGRVMATAGKTSAFTRTIEGEGPSGAFRLNAESVFGRTMLLETRNGTAVISPDHAFTRRASIGGPAADFTTACFAFWLTGMLWRRAAKNSSTAHSHPVG